jgi:hypothetical protein
LTRLKLMSVVVTVLMSPLVKYEAEYGPLQPLPTYSSPFLLRPDSFSSKSGSIRTANLPTSHSYLSTAYSHDHHLEASMPSWPSSILVEREIPATPSLTRSQSYLSDVDGSPGSLISDQATENSYSPQSAE